MLLFLLATGVESSLERCSAFATSVTQEFRHGEDIDIKGKTIDTIPTSQVQEQFCHAVCNCYVPNGTAEFHQAELEYRHGSTYFQGGGLVG